MAKPSSALSRKSSSSAATSPKKMFGDFPPSSSVTGMMLSDAYCMIMRPVVVSPVKAILAMRLFCASGFAGFDAEAVDDVDDAGREDVCDQFHHHENPERRLLGGLQNHAVTRGERRRPLPGCHHDRGVPWDDLAADAEWIIKK